MGQDIYHVLLGKRRTTVSLDQIISVLLSLKLGHDPGTEDAHAAVRAYLQEKLDVLNDPHWTSVSQWLRKEVVLDLLDKKLSAKYEKWFGCNSWIGLTQPSVFCHRAVGPHAPRGSSRRRSTRR